MKNFLACIVLFLFLVLISGIQRPPRIVTAGVNSGQELQSTTTDSTFASNATTTKVCIGTCTLGSIIVSSTTAQTGFSVWDSTAASGTATTKIASFPISAVAGTYVYDLKTTNGIVLDIPLNFNGVVTYTFRKY